MIKIILTLMLVAPFASGQSKQADTPQTFSGDAVLRAFSCGQITERLLHGSLEEADAARKEGGQVGCSKMLQLVVDLMLAQAEARVKELSMPVHLRRDFDTSTCHTGPMVGKKYPKETRAFLLIFKFKGLRNTEIISEFRGESAQWSQCVLVEDVVYERPPVTEVQL